MLGGGTAWCLAGVLVVAAEPPGERPGPHALEASRAAGTRPDEEPEAAPSSMPATPPERLPGPTESDPPRHRLSYTNLLGARINPLGLVDELSMGYQVGLYRHAHRALSDNFLALELHTFVSPAFLRFGPRLRLQPLSVFALAVGYQGLGYFGVLRQVTTFASPWVDYRDTALRERTPLGGGNATLGQQVTLSALLQAQVGPVAARNVTSFVWVDLDVGPEERVYYDIAIDILHSTRGWSMVNDLDVLYRTDFGLSAGLRYTVTHAFYRARDFAPDERIGQPNGPTHRLGPVLLYTFYDRPERRFNRPTIALLGQWWLRHRYRTGVDSSPAIPYAAVAFLFEGTILPDPRRPRRRHVARR